jgi:nucleoid-associated protein YgaU
VYIPSLMLMALHEEPGRDYDRRAAHAGLRSPRAGRARSGQARPWPARAFAATSGRSHAGARTAGLATARARS